MARPWQYTRSRRLLMQGSMWLVLGATVALAYVLDVHRAKTPPVAELVPALSPWPNLALEAPRGWERSIPDSTMVTFVEPDEEADTPGLPRVLAIYLTDMDSANGTTWFLHHLTGSNKFMTVSDPIRICGQPAREVIVGETRAVDDAPIREAVIYACAVLPGGPGVAVELRTARQRPTQADLDLVSAVASKLVQVADPTGKAPEPDDQ